MLLDDVKQDVLDELDKVDLQRVHDGLNIVDLPDVLDDLVKVDLQGVLDGFFFSNPRCDSHTVRAHFFSKEPSLMY